VTETPATPEQPADGQKPRLLFFYSPVEGASRRVDAFLAQVLQRRKNHETFQITRVDATKRTDLVERLRITSLPSLLVVDDRRVRARLERPRGCEDIQELLSPWLR
jgi:thioredoxin-like negative regulator of GroEL